MVQLYDLHQQQLKQIHHNTTKLKKKMAWITLNIGINNPILSLLLRQ